MRKKTEAIATLSAHKLSDHSLGVDFNHSHSGIYADHDHDEIELGPLEDNPIWVQDHVTLVSVGIDIGSSGTQIIFSRINLRRIGENLSSRYVVVSRETLYQSPVALTPYQNERRIDQEELGKIIDDAYNAANLKPSDIDTGAVILTGEALRRENSEVISAILAEQGGEFVCAAAGHHMESTLAAYGSGAAKASYDAGSRILNIDIGGGTTKLAIIDKGQVLTTAAIHVGGRLQVVDAESIITRLEPAGRSHALDMGYQWSVGQAIERNQMEQVAQSMVDVLLDAILQRPLSAKSKRLFLTDPILDFGVIDGVMFSGGVAEYIYQRESRDFGDMGRLLGSAIKRKIDTNQLPWPVLAAGECIRATALGASEYTVQLSGNTIYISNNAALLPRKNLQVLQPHCEFGPVVDSAALAHAIGHHFTAFDLVEGDQDVALAFQWTGEPSYLRLAAFAQALVNALAQSIAQNRPLYLVLDRDIAKTLGNILKTEHQLANEILVIDGIMLRDFDYIDLGRIRMPSFTVPVTVKSLVFNDNMESYSEENSAPAPATRVPNQAAHGHEHGHEQGHEHGHEHDHGHEQGHSHD